jgi:lipopolysaccharide biosynthesis glycosyltransferase
MNACIVIAAEENFRPGLTTLLYSLRKHNPGLPPVKIASASISEFEDCEILAVDPSEYKGCAPVGSRFTAAWHKLEAFRLHGFDQVVLLDSDLLCLGDISELWAETSADIRTTLLKRGVDSSVCVLGKKIRDHWVHHKLVWYGRNGKSYDGGDQGAIDSLLAQFHFKHKPLARKYSVLKRIYKTPQWANIKKDIRLLHFVGSKKPWNAGLPASALERNGGERGYEELEEIWHRYHREATA